ncbi:Pol polyprotein [Plakobranchus ocellatus]|uniref:Pol polyprotein n=1 Tax=Plakobranchus ocellatus TaxID=259542 RepID=A0AAV4CFA3_9GAST|nr:Pol polyprotein [Plakobranchus ocellatus]
MVVEQVTKNTVRPELDFRELNKFVECPTGGDVLDVCSDRLREWRQIDRDIEIVDLKSAYLQIHVAKELWKYQLVKFNGVVYALTRLGFGLTSAPKIMSMILKWVLAQKPEIKQATSSFIDDIMLDVSDINAGDVVAHLKDYGLESKNPEKLDEGAVLGLKLDRDQREDLIFSRANEIPNVDQLDSGLSRRDVFSICGKLVGHYPVAGWLRVACSYVKRQTEGSKWDEYSGDRACDLIREVVVQKEDPVRGKWNVPSEAKGVVWCDASNLALGVVIDIGGVTAEDATWLRKKDDYNHINVAELESALKGMNLGMQWGLKQIVLMSDSEVVSGWLKATLSEERKKGAAEMLIKRRLGVFKSLVDELKLEVEVRYVASNENKADKLTRVSKNWLRDDVVLPSCAISVADLRSLHEQHYFGVERTWYLAKQIDAAVSKKEVKKVVRECERCQSIDPASVRHEPGGGQ